MTDKEKRKHIRVNSVNLLNYVYFDRDLKKESQGMGRTLNVSEAGLLLETNSAFEAKREVSINIGLEEEILSISGIVIFTTPNESGFSKTGIQFKDISADELDILKHHIQSFQL
jgi:hypothetical protein